MAQPNNTGPVKPDPAKPTTPSEGKGTPGRDAGAQTGQSPIEMPGRPGVENAPNRDKAYGPGGGKPDAGTNRPDADRERRANPLGVDPDSPGTPEDVENTGGDFGKTPGKPEDTRPL